MNMHHVHVKYVETFEGSRLAFFQLCQPTSRGNKLNRSRTYGLSKTGLNALHNWHKNTVTSGNRVSKLCSGDNRQIYIYIYIYIFIK